jgi:hypothetical protein
MANAKAPKKTKTDILGRNQWSGTLCSIGKFWSADHLKQFFSCKYLFQRKVLCQTAAVWQLQILCMGTTKYGLHP